MEISPDLVGALQADEREELLAGDKGFSFLLALCAGW